jgi:uncharacterized protein involved in propanediol utilization
VNSNDHFFATEAKEPKISLQTGYAFISGHHGELVQGVFECNGKLEIGLVTLPCHAYHTRAVFYPDKSKDVTVFPPGKTKAKKAATIVLERFTGSSVSGRLHLYSNAPIRIGVGSSTLDTISTILATARAINKELAIEEINSIGVEAETASDPLLYHTALLYAQRKGIVIRNYNKTLPSFLVLGFNTDSNGVDTLTMDLPQYTNQEIEKFALIAELIKDGIEMQNRQMIAEAATLSAQINQKYLPKKHFEEIVEIAKSNDALGVQVSHSGTVVGCLFDPLKTDNAKVEETRRLIEQLGFGSLYRFSI